MKASIGVSLQRRWGRDGEERRKKRDEVLRVKGATKRKRRSIRE